MKPVSSPLFRASSASFAPATGVASPCVSVCRIDATSGWCLGCARSLEEIAAWSSLDDAGKRAVWSLLPARRAQLPPL
jgi:uncharacterized protein